MPLRPATNDVDVSTVTESNVVDQCLSVISTLFTGQVVERDDLDEGGANQADSSATLATAPLPLTSTTRQYRGHSRSHRAVLRQ